MNAWYEQIADTIERCGVQLLGVFDDENTPERKPNFIYTIGLDQKFGFEIIAFGLPFEYGHIIMNDVAAMLFEGGTIELDTPDGRFTNLPVMFKKADQRAREYVVQADRFYDKEVRVYQLVLCDKNGRFPHDEDFDHAYMDHRQPLLYAV